MSKMLLLADDSVVIQKLVGLSFANENIEIVSTDNGDNAVTMARDLRPDIVLADVVMPGLSGYEVCEAIKQDAGLAHTPVLLLTGTFEAFAQRGNPRYRRLIPPTLERAARLLSSIPETASLAPVLVRLWRQIDLLD